MTLATISQMSTTSNARPDGVAGATRGVGLAAQGECARGGPRESAEDLGELGLARADEPEHAEHLAAADRERDGGAAREQRHPTDHGARRDREQRQLGMDVEAGGAGERTAEPSIGPPGWGHQIDRTKNAAAQVGFPTGVCRMIAAAFV